MGEQTRRLFRLLVHPTPGRQITVTTNKGVFLSPLAAHPPLRSFSEPLLSRLVVPADCLNAHSDNLTPRSACVSTILLI